MSIRLDQGSLPVGLEAKSMNSTLPGEYGRGGSVRIGRTDSDVRLSMPDLLALTLYALSNTNLEGPRDPRLKFIKAIKKARTTRGYPAYCRGKQINKKHRRLDIPDIADFFKKS